MPESIAPLENVLKKKETGDSTYYRKKQHKTDKKLYLIYQTATLH